MNFYKFLGTGRYSTSENYDVKENQKTIWSDATWFREEENTKRQFIT